MRSAVAYVLWLSCLLVGVACAAPPRSANTAGGEVAPNRLQLRTTELGFEVAFRRNAGATTYSAVVSGLVEQAALSQQEPRFLELLLDGHLVRVERWAKHEQGTIPYDRPPSDRVNSGLRCAGNLAPKCERSGTTEERYFWHYVIPPDAVPLLRTLQQGRATLAVGQLAIQLDIEGATAAWIRKFFART